MVGNATAQNVAVALPIQAYIPDDGDAFLIVDPRVILSTKNAEETLEVSSVFHTQFGVWDGYLRSCSRNHLGVWVWKGQCRSI